MNEQEKAELAKALEDFFSQENPVEEAAQTDTDTDTETTPQGLADELARIAQVDTEGWNWDNKNVLDNELRPHLDAIRRICERENMSFLFCVVTKYTKGNEYELHSEVGMYSKVCEFLACLGIINLPHDISHQIMHAAATLGNMMGFNAFYPLGKRKGKE